MVNTSSKLDASPPSTPSSISPPSTQAGSSGGIAPAPDGENQSPKGGIASIASDLADNLALGSLSTHSPEAERDAAAQQETTQRKGAFSSLIYGTHEGQQMDKEIERSFSQVLARGKYVHSIVFHKVKPDKVDEYVKLVGDWYPKVASLEENHVHLVGSWRTEVGDCDTFGKNPYKADYSSLGPFQGSGLPRCLAFTCKVIANNSKCISGNTSAIKAITPLSTPLPHTPTFQPLTAPSKPSSPAKKRPSCRNSLFGRPRLHGSWAVSSSFALTTCTPAIYWNGKRIGARD